MGIGNLANIIDCKFQRISRLIQPLPDHRYATEQTFDQVWRDVFSTWLILAEYNIVDYVVYILKADFASNRRTWADMPLKQRFRKLFHEKSSNLSESLKTSIKTPGFAVILNRLTE